MLALLTTSIINHPNRDDTTLLDRADMVGLVSAAGLVGFLSEPDTELKVFALKTLDAEVDSLWTEIAGSIGQMSVSLTMPFNNMEDLILILLQQRGVV